jgi:hypothetical protein
LSDCCQCLLSRQCRHRRNRIGAVAVSLFVRIADPATSAGRPILKRVRGASAQARQVDDRRAAPLPQRTPARPRPGPRGPCRLPRPRRRRTHQLALPNARATGARRRAVRHIVVGSRPTPSPLTGAVSASEIASGTPLRRPVESSTTRSVPRNSRAWHHPYRLRAEESRRRPGFAHHVLIGYGEMQRDRTRMVQLPLKPILLLKAINREHASTSENFELQKPVSQVRILPGHWSEMVISSTHQPIHRLFIVYGAVGMSATAVWTRPRHAPGLAVRSRLLVPYYAFAVPLRPH